jgi:hypothetical protein
MAKSTFMAPMGAILPPDPVPMASILAGKRAMNRPETAGGSPRNRRRQGRGTPHELPFDHHRRSSSSPAIPTVSLSSYDRAHAPLAILIASLATIPWASDRPGGTANEFDIL